MQKKNLRKRLPLSLDGLYDYKNREEFFRQGVFVEFSGQFLYEVRLPYEGQSAYVCFTAARENTVFKHNKTVLIPASIPGS